MQTIIVNIPNQSDLSFLTEIFKEKGLEFKIISETETNVKEVKEKRKSKVSKKEFLKDFAESLNEVKEKKTKTFTEMLEDIPNAQTYPSHQPHLTQKDFYP